MRKQLTLLLLFIPFLSFGADFIAGQDYEVIKAARPGKTQGVTEVTEFFSFGCPWCYRIEPTLNRWVKHQGDKILFKKVPVVFKPEWKYYAKAFYVAEALSLNSKLDPALFKAILDDKKGLNSNAKMTDFFIKNGVDAAIAESAFNHSPSIDMKIGVGLTLMADDRIDAVPAFVINNRFKTDLKMAKTEENLFEILDFLVTQ